MVMFVGFCAFSASAQEICANGLDDDGDGFIDCFDGDCAKEVVCTGGYIGNDLNCEAKPSEFPKFSLSLESASPNETAVHLGRIAVGDVDRDGIPEMVTTNQWAKKIYILNGENVDGVNTIQKQLSVDYNPSYTDVLIGNIDNDNCAEIYVVSTKWKLYGYDCNLNLLPGFPVQMPDDPGMMGLADFNGDGKVELYARNAIYNAHNGDVIVAPGTGWDKVNGGPVAVDILSDATKNVHLPTDAIKDDNLELVCGGVIYSVNIAAGTIKEEKKIPNYGRKADSDATSIADYNLDGSLDVIATGKNTSSGNTTVFFWDVKNNVVKTYADPKDGFFTVQNCNDNNTGEFYKNGWHKGMGRVNIADLDGDGNLNMSFVSGKFLYALDENLQPLSWSPKVVNEETSGNTGCTLFDFNGDGQSEIVYRDERFIYIINGTTGETYASSVKTCVSRTNREYPIVADVDGDGSTELCVTCRTDDFIQNGSITDPTDPAYKDADEKNFCDLGKARYSQVRVFRSGAEPWVPARRVWNQHGYFNVNVNDNLSIPKIQQKHHLVFSENVCTKGKNRPLNGFLNQSPFLNSLGCPKYASPDLAFVDNSLSVQNPTCPEKNFKISFKLTNMGDVPLNGVVPITFYNGDPRTATATKLNTVDATLTGFNTGDVYSVTNATVQGPGSPFTLYIVLNDNGTTSPLKLPNTNFIECNYDNNILLSPVNPGLAPLTAVKDHDNIKCTPGTSPDNGAVSAYVPVGAVKNTTDYTFYWSDGTTAKPLGSTDHTGATYTGVPEGTYTVFALHKTANCYTQTKQAVVDKVTATVDVEIVLATPYDKCSEDTGALTAVVNGDTSGDDASKYTFTWYQGNDVFGEFAGTGRTISGLKPVPYTVVVKEKASGCQNIDTYSIPDQRVKPVVTVTQSDATCTTISAGQASASVGGVTAGYTFKWYKGETVKLTPAFTGPVYQNLAAGKYTVVATRNSTKCDSEPVTIEILQTIPPVVTVTVVGHQTSCDSTQPNGSATAEVAGVTTGYTFEWFAGQNTTDKIATGPTATSLKNGLYTVKVTNDATGCFDTDEVTIDFAVETPKIINPIATHSTTCDPFNGSITVSVDIGTPADYTFYWYKGTTVKATPDFTDNDQTLDGLEPGKYTVKAVFNSRNCEAAPVTVTINNNTPVTNFTVTNLVRPSDCNDNHGELSISVSAPGNTSGFDFEWRKGQPPFIGPAITTVNNTGSTTTAAGLASGAYTLIATSRETGCSTSKVFDLPFDDAQVLSFVSKVDIQTCIPGTDGSIKVRLTPTPGFNEDDYTIYVYEGQNDLGAAGTALTSIPGVNGTSDYDLNAPLQPQSYTFVAVTTNPARVSTYLCRSVPVTVELLQTITTPVFTAQPIMNNENCTGAPGSGQITIDIANPLDYTFTWFEGTDILSPVLGTNTSGVSAGAIASSLPAGKYTVMVTKTSGSSQGCFSTATYQVFDDQPTMIIEEADVTLDHITECFAANSGSATVNFVSENGARFSPANYTFKWYTAGTSGPELIIGQSLPVLSSLTAGTYYVEAINTTSNCSTSGLVEFTILDKTINTVAVDLVSFVIPTQCLQPVNIEGSLEVVASGNSASGYTYNWYAGQSTSGILLTGTNIGGANGEIAQGLTAGFYTIEVINNSTHCPVTETYELPLQVVSVPISASAEPLTVCLDTNKDGSVFAVATNGHKNNYDYLWYNGNVKATPDFTSVPSAPTTDLSVGTYIVKVVDKNDAACFATTSVVVEDKRTYPAVTTEALAPLTICDPSNPDGVAAAHVNGATFYHRFDWFANATATGTPIYTGSQASGLSAGTFSVRATDIISGCTGTATVNIEVMQLPIPVPAIEVVSMVTSCIDDNGILTASVNGNTSEYIFNWFNGTAEKSLPDFTGERYDSLAVGSYSLVAISRETGCKSPVVTAQITSNPEFPLFSVTSVSSVCREDSNEPGTGFAALFMTNSVAPDSIIWTFNGSVVATGPVATNLDAGVYDVTVISTMGCETTQRFEVKTEIHPFNGISRNNDGQNDIFHINCIESFPTNVVKIYNRAGTMVYEAQGYDNNGTFFDGQSNRGLSVMGTDLPGGTYFYIIDKRDGSKPIAGYLELVN